MKNYAVLFLLLTLSLAATAQKSKPAKKPNFPLKSNVAADAGKTADEKGEFDKAVAVTDAAARVAALEKFIKSFPQSAEKNRALEILVSSRAAVGDEKLRLNENESGIALFKSAVKDAPAPLSDKLFSEILLQFPTNLFLRGQQQVALEIARMIEEKAAGNPKQLLGLATFYLSTENAAEAERLARKAIALDSAIPAAYQTLGLANRINFQLDEAVAAYAKALELDPASSVSKRSLAEMNRAVGKPDEAARLYREILTADAGDAGAQTGLILALFDDGKRAEAESAMQKALEVNPNNLLLLVGAAYWYAAKNDGAQAVELARRAVAVEPRYTWAHIALARGLIRQKQPLEAERTLITARQYGNFPTLDYEIAAARLEAGFFREAAEILRQNFSVKGDVVETRLGGRVVRENANFTELLAPERRAGIFEPLAADSAETAEQLKTLLAFTQKLGTADEAEIDRAADEFVKGSDKMRVHRQIYAANNLVQSSKSLPKALEIVQAAIGKSDDALDVPSAAAAVLADELYESRTLAASRNQLIVVPNVPRQTLSAIMRGRIEEIAGWTLYRQNNAPEAVVRLKRAVSVLPENSAWWRSSMWRLGAALQTDGKEKEALAAYLRSYSTETSDAARYSIIESLYQKVNGSLDGLEASLGARPAALNVAAAPTTSEIQPKSPPAGSGRRVKIPDNVPLSPISAAPTAEIVRETTAAAPIRPKNDAPAANTAAPKPKETAELPAETAVKIIDKPTSSAETVSAAEARMTAEQPAIKATNPPLVETAQDENTTPAEIQPTVRENPAAESDSEKSANAAPQIPKQTRTVTPETPSISAAKPLFEPVVITVPKPELLKIINSELPAAKNPLEDNTAPKENAERAQINDATAQTSALTTENSAANTDLPRSRPRIVAAENTAQSINPCSIVVNEESISLLNGGGSLGVLIGFRGGDGDLKELQAVSSSPNDVEIIFEPAIIAPAGRAFFVIKSVSSKTGVFTVTFEAPCGKKELTVKVR